MSITPTVGRKVWFYADDEQCEPEDATVVKTWGQPATDMLVNLAVTDKFAVTRLVSSVKAIPDDGEKPQFPGYRWMPYQQAQAAKSAPSPTNDEEEKAAPSAYSYPRFSPSR